MVSVTIFKSKGPRFEAQGFQLIEASSWLLELNLIDLNDRQPVCLN